MKVPNSVRLLYDENRELYLRLQREVDRYFLAVRRKVWHYQSRVKEIESYSLKLETGRYNPEMLEDFFACMIVVENYSTRKPAEKVVSDRFQIKERRPQTDTITTKGADCFRFDDLRLYVIWSDPPAQPPTGLAGLVFEVQVKTFLQHAWGISTHDLVFKADEKSWPKERIAFQVRAMLEHAEVAIHEAELLSQSQSILMSDPHTNEISEAIRFFRNLWAPELLPRDLKRLAGTFVEFLRASGLSLAKMREIIVKETNEGRGTHIRNLSPYGVIIKSLMNQQPDAIRRFGTQTKGKFRLFVCPELEVPAEFNLSSSPSVVFPKA